jgi:serine/threonine protein phosphatase PrpC
MYLIANQLELSGGTRRDRSECLVDAELNNIPPPTIQKRGALYILTETETMAAGQPRPGDIDLCREAQDIIVHEYYNANLTTSITSALRNALEKANQAIFNHNSAVLPPERRGLGITVALARNNELYTAQMAPTQALLCHNGEIQYLPAPADPSQGRPTGPRAVQARTGTDAQATLPMPRRQSLPSLGRYSLIEPNLNRHLFEDGDLLVLCSSQFAQALRHEDVEWILANQDSRSALLNLSEFARNKGITDAYALTIGVRPDPAARYQTPPHRDEAGIRGAAESVAGAFSLLTSKFNRPGHETEEFRSSQPNYNEAETQPFRTEPTRQRTWNETEFMTQQPSAEPQLDPSDPLAPLISNSRENDPWLIRENDNLDQPAYLRGRKPSPPEAVNIPPAAPTADPVFKQQYAQTFKVGTSRLEAATPPVEPPEAEPETAWGTPPAETRKSRRPWRNRETVKEREKTASAEVPYFDMVEGDGYGPPAKGPSALANLLKNRTVVLAGIGVALAFAVLLLILSVAGSKISGNSSKALDYIKAAEQKRAQAQQLASSDPTRARTLLVQAQTDIESARKEKSDLPELVTAQRSLKVTQDNINRVVVPTDLRVSLDLTSQGTGVRLSKIIFNQTFDGLYLLDAGRGAVYSADLQGAVKTILKTGDKSGNMTFGKPLAMVARPDGVLVLDDGNLIWIYNHTANSWTVQTLGGAAGWGSKAIRQVSSYQGNLYLLGPGNGQILKYNAGSYSSPPEEWLNPGLAPNLSLDSATGFSIDGTIYALSNDGKLYQLARPNGKNKGEVVQQFDLKQGDKLGPPLNNPTVLNVGSLDFPYYFVLDGEKRVMQFRKQDGGFVQQFQAATGHNEFDNLQDVGIDETNKKLYIVGLQKVYVFNLPETAVASDNAAPQANLTPGSGSNVTVITGSPTPRS